MHIKAHIHDHVVNPRRTVPLQAAYVEVRLDFVEINQERFDTLQQQVRSQNCEKLFLVHFASMCREVRPRTREGFIPSQCGRGSDIRIGDASYSSCCKASSLAVTILH